MPAVPSHPEFPCSDWTTARVIDLVQRRFNKRPCRYQIEAAKAFYVGRDVIGCALTGAGKTLLFWIPLLMAQEDRHKKILFVVSPLNVLAKQNVETLTKVGISAVAVAVENATSSTFKVCDGCSMMPSNLPKSTGYRAGMLQSHSNKPRDPRHKQ
jgi:ATP-dependent helicase YprA (DUF1998 family)